MKKTKSTPPEDKLSKSVALVKVILLVLIGVWMLISTPSLREAIGQKLASNCPAYTEYGACVLEHGLRAGLGATAAAGVWSLAAIIILIAGVRGIYKYIRSSK